MRHAYKKTATALTLYLRICALMAPLFLVAAGAGLYLLTKHNVDEAEARLNARLGEAANRIAGGLERLADQLPGGEAQAVPVARELVQSLTGDPAVVCAELHAPGKGRVLVQMPGGITCAGSGQDGEMSVPVRFFSEQTLTIGISHDELHDTKIAQLQLSALILVAGLMIMLITNWITFRLIIGRSLSQLMDNIEEAKSRAEQSALHDALTGLGNRRHLNEVITERLGSLHRDNEPFAVLQLDLDHFTEVNDSLGHSAGDQMLRHVAETLQTQVRSEDFVARVGGDEFVIVTKGDSSRVELAAMAERLVKEVSTPISYQGQSCFVETSIGIYSVEREKHMTDMTVDYILNNGDFALKHAKESGRGNFVFFEDSTRVEMEADRFLREDFRRGVDDGEIICHYQPQYDLNAGRVLSVEALVRWYHPLHGVMTPEEFMPLADRLGMTAHIDALVFKAALADLAKWDELGLGIETVSVNVSAGRLSDPDLIANLQAMNLPRNRLTFEILETAFVDRLPDQVQWNLDGIRELGIEIELDDFGTGKASVLGIIEMAPDRIKVARELIAPLAEGEQGLSLVRAVAAIGHSLGVEMVAEGVEMAVHCEAAAELGFARLQGYHICRPVSAKALADWLQDGSVHDLPGLGQRSQVA
ncbi:MAG: EAL domain-containing protein [Pseudomonadota bacterium]